MSSELLQVFIVLMASIGALLFAWFLARVIGKAQSAPTSAGAGPAGPAAAAPAAGPPTPQEVELAQSPPPMTLLDIVRQRRTRRLNLADARTGIVLAAILEPCRSHPAAEDRTST